jgi:hypothetical protein
VSGCCNALAPVVQASDWRAPSDFGVFKNGGLCEDGCALIFTVLPRSAFPVSSTRAGTRTHQSSSAKQNCLRSSREPQWIAVARRLSTTNKMHNACQNVSQFRHLGGGWFRRVTGTVNDAANNGSTPVANINSRASNELRNLILILAAEGTMKNLSKEHICFLRDQEKRTRFILLPTLRCIKRVSCDQSC